MNSTILAIDLGKFNSVLCWYDPGAHTERFRTAPTTPDISVAFSPDGTRLASAGFDRTVRLWEMTTGREVLPLRGHTSLVGRVVFSPDASRIKCQNNLKQLGLALHHYHDSNSTFPPGTVGPQAGVPGTSGLMAHGLGSYVLPYLEQDPLARQYDRNVSWYHSSNQQVVNTQLKVWQCPSAEANRMMDGSLPTIAPPAESPFNGTAACGDYAGISKIDPALASLGLVDRATSYDGILQANRTTRIAEISDGTSTTILMAECAGRPVLWRAGKPVPGVRLNGGPWASRGLMFGRGSTPDGIDFFGRCAINCTNDREVYSFHTGGANAVFADGSVHFLKATIDIRVFAQLVTRAGGEVVSAGDY